MAGVLDKITKTLDPQFQNGLINKAVCGMLLELPHILTIAVLVWLYSEQWIGIIILGWVLPDFCIFFHMFVYPAAVFKKGIELRLMGYKKKKISHILTFVVAFFLLFTEHNAIAFAGLLHIMFDMVGF